MTTKALERQSGPRVLASRSLRPECCRGDLADSKISGPDVAVWIFALEKLRGLVSPLLETGDLRDSIERDVQQHVAYVGSNDNKALWHEFGTSRIPPRPFLGGAAAAKHEESGEMIGKSFHALLIKG